ncbi:MAG: transcription elongation factor GreA [Ruminiclostridium sp.]|nr:transcription elongation factor GreA [Ruminiclostridium sp.]MBQ8410778.1 transcription elongation factor GreA [Ruminiclostridium sp.]MBQ8842552.1 transcription elongation factor GreA [Ruminiclostridium sp.]
MAKQTVLTSEGLKKLEEELDELKSVKRREVAEKIKVALGYGDLSENSEYDEAKNEQGLIEARIAEIEATLKNVKIIDEDNLSTEHVQLGNTVTVKDIDEDEILVLHIVGSKEVDVDAGKISDESPIGKALIGHSKGDVVDVEAPAGTFKFEIIDIGK